MSQIVHFFSILATRWTWTGHLAELLARGVGHSADILEDVRDFALDAF